MKLLRQYFSGDTTPYRLNAAEWSQAKSFVVAHPEAMSAPFKITGAYSYRNIYFALVPGAAPLLDGLLGIATGKFKGNELVGISDTFNFDKKQGRGTDLAGFFANLGATLIRRDAGACSGDISIPITGGP